MKRAGFLISVTLFAFVNWSTDLVAQTNSAPKFEEVYQLLRAKGGLSEAELNSAAVRGLLNELRSRVVLGTNTTQAGMKESALSRVSVLENSFGYFRVKNVESGLSDGFMENYQKLLATNKLKGLVLDLRYADGLDYAAAAKMADFFIKTEQPLLRWDKDVATSVAKTNAITLPIAVVVNHETSGAAEALAGILREAQIGLIIGTNTAGQASVFKEFPLSDGQKLKIAAAPVKLGTGKEIGSEGLPADIEVALKPEEEKEFYEDSYREVPADRSISSAGKTNSTESAASSRARRRLNEAELVRLQREGITPDQDFLEGSAKTTEPGKPVLSDPVLIRALDLLKGLAVYQSGRK